MNAHARVWIHILNSVKIDTDGKIYKLGGIAITKIKAVHKVTSLRQRVCLK